MIPPHPEPFDAEQARQHLTTLLLAGAVNITYAVEKMEKFAAAAGNVSELDAAAQMADAIALMTQVRADLMDQADQLSDPPPS
ncbi:hypothetical protein AB0G04_36285 [Actinoplanes sp. NPDC023801]|uniref:hypothetical protein n=1 Tax=Actinoplanes sp. NPDC023801 TaxID=3154595 RepID=UPI003409E71B